jgi:hypothetical protein
VNLKEDVVYKWFVTLITDTNRRSKDLLSGGAIQRIVPPPGLRERLDKEGRNKATHIYAEAGVWYDAMAAVSEMIRVSPGDIPLRKIRASLLEQAGLRQVAEYEMKIISAR